MGRTTEIHTILAPALTWAAAGSKFLGSAKAPAPASAW